MRSTRELATWSAEDVAALRELNSRYRDRFGFPLKVCEREHTKESIMACGAARLDHSREEEIDTALNEIAKIARLRLSDVVDDCAEGAG